MLFGGLALAMPSAALAEGLTGAHVEVRLGYERLEEAGNPDGVTYGVKVGYQAPVGKIVFVGFDVGIESGTTRAFGDKKDFDLSATAKIGPRIGDKTLIYVMGGYSRLKTKSGRTLDGWRAGVGSQFLLSPSSYMGLEFDYTRYNSFALDVTSTKLLAGYRF